MSIRNLDNLFNPRTIAVIGANEGDKSISQKIFNNLIGGDFKGIIYSVNTSIRSVFGNKTYPTVAHIPHHVDLALVATDPTSLSMILDNCGEKGVKGVIIFASDTTDRVKQPSVIKEQIRKISVQHGCRVLGPNSLGFIYPANNLNASLCPLHPLTGNIAVVAESGFFPTTFIQHAIRKKIGFSYFISLGSKLDIDIADTIDFLGRDGKTRAIFLFLKTINDGRKFMAAARSYARRNPIIIVKSGRTDTRSYLIHSDVDPLFDEDRVYEALFNRAGCLRVNNGVDLLNMVETLAKLNRPKGKRLMIISNSIAPSQMAADALWSMGGVLAVPRGFHNPLCLASDASAPEYQMAIQNCLQNPEVDGVLVICSPCPGIDVSKIARSTAKTAKCNPRKPLFFTLFAEGTHLDEDMFLSNGDIPIYLTPEHAVKSFMYMYHYDHNLKLLQKTPEIISNNPPPNQEPVKKIIQGCMEQKRYTLHTDESHTIMRLYGIPVIEKARIRDEDEAVRAAQRIGYPITMMLEIERSRTLRSDKIVFNNRKNDNEVQRTFSFLQGQIDSPDDSQSSVIVQPMINKHCYELMVGAQKDLHVGSFIKFGLGGYNVRKERDYSIGLPPLNQTQARKMIEEAAIYPCLKKDHFFQKRGLRSLEEILVRLSQLIVDFPHIGVIDINPLIIMDNGCIARDVVIQIDKNIPQEYLWAKRDVCPVHLSIPPYPFQYQKDISLKDGTILHVRPIRGEDEACLRRFFEKLSEGTVFSRFGQYRINLPHEHLVRLCQVDYDRDLAFLAVVGDEEAIVGDARLNRLANHEMAELSFVVADQWQGKGIGGLLMDFCILVAKEIGLKTLLMEVLQSNERMKRLGYKYGFQPLPCDEEDDMVELQLKICREAGDELMFSTSTKEKYNIINNQAAPATSMAPLW